MKLLSSFFSKHQTTVAPLLVMTTLVFSPTAVRAAITPALLDDFSNPKYNQQGGLRLLIDDKSVGSQSQATRKCQNGVIAVEGELVPGRGVPAFISLVSLLSLDGQAHDLSQYTGVRLRVKVNQGSLTVQVASSEIKNYDFHTSSAIARTPGEFQEVRIPFKAMKRVWSEQTVLNLKSVTSINLVTASMAKDAFAYEIDEVGFY